jgi:hypothetical protein
MTLEPPPHRGPFSREQLLGAAARLRACPSHPDNDTPEFSHLKKGKVTLVTGLSNTTRSRFIVGLIIGMLDSGRASQAPTILYCNRRWTHQEATKALVQQTADRMIGGDYTDFSDALIMAIQVIERSGLVYDNTARTIPEVTKRVSDQIQALKLIVVDGLEHFISENCEENSHSRLTEMLNQLKALAKATMLPIIVSAPPLDGRIKV